MTKESLDEATRIIIDNIEKSSLTPLDKAELMLNLYHFLDYEKYSENILILNRRRK